MTQPAQQAPLAEATRVKFNDPDAPFTLVVTLKASSVSAGGRIEAIFAQVPPAVRQEPGCLVYEQSRSVSDPTRFVLDNR